MARKKQGHGPSQRGRPGKEWPKWKAVTSEADDRLPAPPPQPAAGDRHDGSAAAQRQPRGLLSLEPHVMTSRVSRQQTATPAVQCPAVLRPLPAALLRQSAVRSPHHAQCLPSVTDRQHACVGNMGAKQRAFQASGPCMDPTLRPQPVNLDLAKEERCCPGASHEGKEDAAVLFHFGVRSPPFTFRVSFVGENGSTQ